MARPLLEKHNIASVLIENPFYGPRKPPDQFRSSLRRVVDMFSLGAALVFEASALVAHVRDGAIADAAGFKPLSIPSSLLNSSSSSSSVSSVPLPICLTGVSMGGHTAALTAAANPLPLGVVACMTACVGSECSCDVQLGSLHSAHANFMINTQLRFYRAPVTCSHAVC
jgi:hypothetical protein